VTKAGDYLAAASLKDANLRMTKRQQGADLLGQRDQASTCTKGKAKVDTLAVKDGGWRLAVGGIPGRRYCVCHAFHLPGNLLTPDLLDLRFEFQRVENDNREDCALQRLVGYP
jgi:hypothetical protein